MHVPRDRIHRSRAVKGDTGDNILYAVRPKLLHKRFHARTLDLEHSIGIPGGDEIKDLFLLIACLIDLQTFTGALFDHIDSVLYYRQVLKPQKVHLQKPQAFHGILGELRDNDIILRPQGDVIYYRLLRYHHSRRMGARMARQPFQRLGGVYQPLDLRLCAVTVHKLRVIVQSLIYGDIQLVGDHLGYPVYLAVGDIERPANVTHGKPRLHRTEGDYLRHLIRPVLFHDIIYHLLPPVRVEVGIYIGHTDALGVQKPLEYQSVPYGVYCRYIQAIGCEAAGRAAAARPYHHPMGLGVMDKIPDYKEVIDKTHALYNAQLIGKPLPQLLGRSFVLPLKPLKAQLPQVLATAFSLGNLIGGQMAGGKVEIHPASLGYLFRVLYRLRI